MISPGDSPGGGLRIAALLLIVVAGPVRAGDVKVLFDGKTLEGWTLVGTTGRGYVVENGLLVCPADGGGNLFTAEEYADFVFSFEFKLERASNNGVGIRAPLEGDAAYVGMEIQILDDDAPDYKDLQPGQYCGSIYKVVAAERGALRPVGSWNSETIEAIGRRVKVTLNGRTIVDADLNRVTDRDVLLAHPGMLRDRGRIGFLGHQSRVEFRNVRVEDRSAPAAENAPPEGFTALFDGRGLAGWKGLVQDPPARARMAPEALATAQAEADRSMAQHWRAVSGELRYDGSGTNLCTAKDYRDFELLVDWKIEPGGDSGIYLRGSPQVQIWDRPEGSGGLYNNQKHPSGPSARADRPPGEWNRFRILMIGERVTVFLNGRLVVQAVPMENYWEREKPIYPTGAIELQHHGSALAFKNIYLREIPPP